MAISEAEKAQLDQLMPRLKAALRSIEERAEEYHATSLALFERYGGEPSWQGNIRRYLANQRGVIEQMEAYAAAYAFGLLTVRIASEGTPTKDGTDAAV